MESKPEKRQRIYSGICSEPAKLRSALNEKSSDACHLKDGNEGTLLENICQLQISDFDYGEKFGFPSVKSLPEDTAPIKLRPLPSMENLPSTFQKDSFHNNSREMEGYPGDCSKSWQEPWCDEWNTEFRSRTDSGFGSFSDYSSANTESELNSKFSDNTQNLQSTPLSFVRDTMDQSSFDSSSGKGSATRRNLPPGKFLHGLLLDNPENVADHFEKCIYVGHSEIIFISPESLAIQDPSSIFDEISSNIVPNPNDYHLHATSDDSDEQKAKQRASETALAHTHINEQNFADREQQCDLVSKMERDDGVSLTIVVKSADCVVIGNNTTVNQRNLKFEDVSENRNIRFTILPEALRNVIKDDLKDVPGALRRSGSIAGKRYIHIMECMRKYQDSGHTQELEKFAEAMVNRLKKDEVDLKVVILLEHALYFIYQQHLKDAKIIVDEAICMAKRAENGSLLLGRCHIFLAHILLYEKKYPETLECLENAATFLENFVSGEDKAWCCYLYGYTYLKMADEGTESCLDLESKAISYFQMAIHHAKEDPESRVRDKKMRYCLFKQISVYLRTYSAKSKQLPVGEKEIENAKHLLRYFEDHHWDDAPPGTRVHYFSLKSDYFFREKRFKRAIGILKGEGMETARGVGHRPLLNMVDDRIKYLEPFEKNLQEASVPDVNNDIERFDELDE